MTGATMQANPVDPIQVRSNEACLLEIIPIRSGSGHFFEYFVVIISFTSSFSPPCFILLQSYESLVQFLALQIQACLYELWKHSPPFSRMGHALSIDAVINIIFGIAMTAIGVITIAQTAHLARLYSRSTGMLSISN